MMRYCITAIVFILFFSCAKKKETCTKPAANSKFEMYEMSEMAMLMEQMYADNERVRQKIIAGDSLGAFPQHFLKIHQAVMTDKQENDEFFKEHAAQFIASQTLIYKDPSNAKQHFNASIDACVACHEVKCGGPIVRIKKLYIQ